MSANTPSQRSSPSPYTTLFRSDGGQHLAVEHRGREDRRAQPGHAARDVDVEGVADPAGEVVVEQPQHHPDVRPGGPGDRKSTRLNSSHVEISYAVFCLKKKK